MSAVANRAGRAQPVARATAAESGRNAALTAGIARGDREAFAAFYAAWFARSFALARRTLRSDEDGALDVVQDVMLKVARSMPALPDERAVEAWMARAVFSVAIDRLRAGARRLRHERRAQEQRHERSPAGGDPSALREQAEWLQARLLELPERDRAALLLRFESDATLAGVGEALGISGHAAHGRIRRTVARLRRLAQEVFGDGST